MSDKYFYRPLVAFAGKVFKCAGICDEVNIGLANEIFLETDEAYIKGRGNVYLPGFIVLDGYRGDKVVIGGDNIAKEFNYGDPVTEKPVIKVEVRNVFGVFKIYPMNEAAELIAKIAGTKTITNEALAYAERLGFLVEEVAVKKLAA